MKLAEVQIHNFRSIHDEKFSLLDYTLLVGANNAGKSAVVDSLRCFYEKDGYKFDKDKDFPRMPCGDEESWIEMIFNLSPEESATLPEYAQLSNNQFRVRKFLLTAKKDGSGNKMQGAIYAYKTDGKLNDQPFYGAKAVQQGKFGKVVYIPAVSTVDEHTKLTAPSALRDLLNNVLEDVVAKSVAYERFEKDFQDFSSTIKTESDLEGRSLTGLEAELNKRTQPWGAEFKLNIKPPTTSAIVKNLVEQEFIDSAHKTPQNANQYGSGFQRQFIFSIVEVASRYVSRKVATKKDFSPDYTLILFEEPEAYLHPPQQEILARSLQQIAQNSERQVICSTHSPHFVSKNARELNGIVRMCRVDGHTNLYQLDKLTWDSIIDTNQSLNAIAVKYKKLKDKLTQEDLMPDMEAVKYFLWLDPDRCGLFFANHVLLVEGPTEKSFISRLLGESKIEGNDKGVTVIDTIGKFNIHRFMNLLSALGVPHSVLVDEDENKDEHVEINQLIIDSVNPKFTHKVEFLPKDLEDALGVPPTHDHRKPQHIMMLYEQGKIDAHKLDTFCRLVGKLIEIK